MIITLIVVGIIIGTIVCFIIANKTWSEIALDFGILFTIISCGLSLGVSVAIIDAQVNKDIKYQNTLYEKEMLEYRIDNIEDNIIGNEMLYNDIVEFNNNLRETKKWANNLWVNWFYNQDIATIDYVEIESK